MYILYLLTFLLLGLSFYKDQKKTMKALKIAWEKFLAILPAFLVMLILSAVALHLLPEELILTALDNENKLISLSLASVLGSLLILPGFIAFPLSGLLISKGISYMIISAFTTTLMMVGILSYPIEQKYFGIKSTIIRNVLSLITALIVAVCTGYLYNELH